MADFLGTVAASSNNAINPTFPVLIAVPVGATIVVGLTSSLTQANVTSVTDSQGNTYTLSDSGTSSAPPNVFHKQYWCRVVSELDPSDTINVTTSTGLGRAVLLADAFNGMASSPLDIVQHGGASSTSNAAVAAPATGTLAQANEILVITVGSASDTAAITVTGYTQASTAVSTLGSNERRGTNLYKVVSSTATSTPSGTMPGGAQPYSIVLGTYKKSLGAKTKYWNGTTWVDKSSTVKYWNGSAWVAKPLKAYVGTWI